MANVLLAEDSVTQAKAIQLMLEEAGHTVKWASNGREALDAMRISLPDVVVTDLEMPELNGLQLVEAVRQDFSSIPVILLTAHGSEEVAALALRKGAASYVPKAYMDQDLLLSLDRILAVTKVDRFNRQALENLTSMELQFALHSDPALTTPIIGHLGDLLSRLGFCDATECMRVGVALQEALLNAMHHGNLEVNSELRQEDEKKFHAALRERRKQAPYKMRRVYLTVKLKPAEAVYAIRDEGPGFDPSLLPDPTDPTNLERVGGRGLLLIRTFMDNVFHNESGNEITMVKRKGK